MDPKDRIGAENWAKNFTFQNQLQQCTSMNNQPFNPFNSEQHQPKWDNSSLLDNSMRIDTFFSKLNQPSENPPSLCCDTKNQTKITNQDDVQINHILGNGKIQEWDPRAMLNNLQFLEDKIHQLQGLLHMIIGRRSQVSTCPEELVTQQQQLITADLTSIIVQLISTAGSLLPSVKQNLSAAGASAGQLGQLNGILFPSTTDPAPASVPQNTDGLNHQNGAMDVKSSDQSNQGDQTGCCIMDQNSNHADDHEPKDEDDANDEEHLPPGSYEILQLEKEEILAPHTHFCTICGKGFKRDANLRMHMRGHGDEYKTPAALAKPHKESGSEPVLLKRYSCPYLGCKRNKDHKKFQPLKTILCVKNHYKRTHCDKNYTCSRCHNKKFSVIADLKTHEKHCGRDKWLCSCGTSFSRKDKLFGHITLFQGHTPAIPLEENKGLAASGSSFSHAENNEAMNKVGVGGSKDFNFSSGNSMQSMMDIKGSVDDSFFSMLNFDSSNFSGLIQDFPQSSFDDSGSALSFLLSGEKIEMPSGTNSVG